MSIPIVPAMEINKLNSMGIPKLPAETRIVVAMSGGVDSSVTAALMKLEGYDTIGLTMQLYNHSEATAKSKTCCAGQDVYDARRVADKIEIPHYVVDYESTFKADVMDRFADSYIRGETPVPCVLCNQTVKFRDLLKVAKNLGADVLATGHYIRRIQTADEIQMHRAVDLDKDQSYFLYATTREQLKFLRFPLGNITKQKVREIARDIGIHISEKIDSQDICFVPSGHYSDVIQSLRPDAAVPGEIMHIDGRVLRSHDGVIHFTVGQRRGLGLGGEPEALYVVEIDPELARVIVGPKSVLLRKSFYIHSVNWLGPESDHGEDGLSVQVKLRNSQEPLSAVIFRDRDKAAAQVVLIEPQGAVAPGQACVFYCGERVLGGGWISRDSTIATHKPHNLRHAKISPIVVAE